MNKDTEKGTEQVQGEEQIQEQNQEQVQEQNQNKEKELKQKRRIVEILGIVVTILFFLMVMLLTTLKYNDVVYPNVTIYGKSVAKYDEKELYEFLTNIEKKLMDKKICVNAGGKKFNVKASKLIKDTNKKELCNELTEHNSNFIKEFGLIVFDIKTDYRLDIRLNKDKLQKEIDKISDKTDKDSIEPKVKIDGNNIKLVSGKEGVVLKKKQLSSDIKNAISNSDESKSDLNVSAKYVTSSPKINISDLKCVDTRISVYSTTYGTGGGRGSNIENAASKLDDLLLMPKEEFSYEGTIGPTTAENGYRSAPVISNGELKSGLGGGVCQVSSTMYNAQLKAGILPTERSNHSKPVSYVPRGLDATLASGSINYKFKNTYKYPLVINTYTTGGRLYIEFWSNKNATEGITYEAKSFASGKVANAYLFGYDKNGKEVYKKHIDTSIYR